VGGAINLSVISAHFTQGTYFLIAQTYKRIHLITRVYGIGYAVLFSALVLRVLYYSTALVLEEQWAMMVHRVAIISLLVARSCYTLWESSVSELRVGESDYQYG
jgi:thiol:disulfide interchange protein